MAILAGVGAGLLVAMLLIARQERRYRALFSDTHLTALAQAVEASRTGAPSTTFEGITVSWERLPKHVAVVLSCKGSLAAPAARFLTCFVRELIGEAERCQGLMVGKASCAALWDRAAIDGERAVDQPDAEALAALRQRAADAMKDFAVVEGALAAYR